MGCNSLLPCRNLIFALLLVGLGAVLTSCSQQRPATKINAVGAIGIVVERRWAADASPAEVSDKVYFIRLRDNEKLNKQQELFHSNFHRDGQVYLLNAKPGRYVVVAASDTVVKPGTTKGLDTLRGLDDYKVYTTYFNEALVKRTELLVRPDQFVVAGNYLVKMENAVNFGDKIQRHFYKVVNSTITDPYGAPIIDQDNSDASRASLQQDRGSGEWEMQFLAAAKRHLAGSEWTKLVQDRIDALRRK